MKSALRRALSIADEIESFKWAGFPGDDPDGIYASIHYLRSLAIKLRAAAQGLGHPWLRNALERLAINIDGNDFDEGVALHAELEAIAGWLRDAIEEWGDDPSRWPHPQGAVADSPPGNRDEKPLHTKERESLLKLVIGMATAYHGYDPGEAKSEIPMAIVGDLERLGLSIDVGTVRKFLKQGLKLLPGNFNEQDS